MKHFKTFFVLVCDENRTPSITNYKNVIFEWINSAQETVRGLSITARFKSCLAAWISMGPTSWRNQRKYLTIIQLWNTNTEKYLLSYLTSHPFIQIWHFSFFCLLTHFAVVSCFNEKLNLKKMKSLRCVVYTTQRCLCVQSVMQLHAGGSKHMCTWQHCPVNHSLLQSNVWNQ